MEQYMSPNLIINNKEYSINVYFKRTNFLIGLENMWNFKCGIK